MYQFEQTKFPDELAVFDFTYERNDCKLPAAQREHRVSFGTTVPLYVFFTYIPCLSWRRRRLRRTLLEIDLLSFHIHLALHSLVSPDTTWRMRMRMLRLVCSPRLQACVS